MKYDAFSRCHPAVNFLYFVGAIGFGVVIQHPAYIAAGIVGSMVYYLLLSGRKGWKMIAGLVPLVVLITLINPFFNTLGKTVLFYVFGKPYSIEALCYGMAVGGIFAVMMLWFGCYNVVLTSDKFTSLFGNLIPALSLLLVMVLRMIPNFLRKARQIIGSRSSIGKGAAEDSTLKEKARDGLVALSALTDWALEGSIVTADSMRARGYGVSRRTSFRIYRMRGSDWVLLAVMAALAGATIVFGGTDAEFIPYVVIRAPGWGFAAYCLYLLIPTALHIKEAITWHILRSRI